MADLWLVAHCDLWLFGEVLLDIRFKPADQISSLFRSVIWRSVAELVVGLLGMMVGMVGMLLKIAGKSARYAGELAVPEPLDAVR